MPMQERRRAVRHKSFLRGNIQFNNGRNSADCLIRDITTFGARLVCSDSITTPDVVDVYIPQKEQTFRAHVIWRHGQEIGVAFALAAAANAADHSHDLELSARVERLENELAAMKRLLKRMRTDTGADSDVA
jgi:PilZ domain-containing protein